MRVVARDRDVPLFDRREIMRHWNDNGNFDLNLATKDVTTAYKVHDCLGRALTSLVIEAAHLDGIESEADAVMVFQPPFSGHRHSLLAAVCLTAAAGFVARAEDQAGTPAAAAAPHLLRTR